MDESRVTASGRRGTGPALPWALAGALAVSSTGLAWLAFGPEDHGDPVAASITAFTRQNTLTVFSAELSTVVTSEDARLLGLLESRQVAVIPARVDYTVNFAGIDTDDVTWNAETRELVVSLPDVTVSRPNLDEARAQYLREGVFITRAAQDSLTRDNTIEAERLAAQQAANPVLLNLARDAARQAISQNLAVPLAAVGEANARVTVRFAGEPPAR
jgi:hypothetical protein